MCAEALARKKVKIAFTNNDSRFDKARHFAGVQLYSAFEMAEFLNVRNSAGAAGFIDAHTKKMVDSISLKPECAIQVAAGTAMASIRLPDILAFAHPVTRTPRKVFNVFFDLPTTIPRDESYGLACPSEYFADIVVLGTRLDGMILRILEKTNGVPASDSPDVEVLDTSGLDLSSPSSRERKTGENVHLLSFGGSLTFWHEDKSGTNLIVPADAYIEAVKSVGRRLLEVADQLPVSGDHAELARSMAISAGDRLLSDLKNGK